MSAYQAQQRRADDAAWREQYQDLKAREAWHYTAEHDLAGTVFADCPSVYCIGQRPLPPRDVPR